MARPERFELPTYWFEASRSIRLSYGRAARALRAPILTSWRLWPLTQADGQRKLRIRLQQAMEIRFKTAAKRK